MRLPQDSLVHTLQDRLRIIHAAAPTDNIGFDADLDPAPLVGDANQSPYIEFHSDS
jgi:hypothetical protein